MYVLFMIAALTHHFIFTLRYEEAELAKTRLEQLRMHEENRRREELRSQQLAERLGEYLLFKFLL